MPSNTENVKLGVCSVTFNGVDLGYTKGGVEVEVNTETKKVMVDQFGNSEINEYITGRTCKAKVPLAETTLENLVRIMPGAVMTGEGGAKATATITFTTAAPVTTDTITINGVTFTYKTSPDVSNPLEMAIPLSITAAAVALAAVLNASVDPLISQFTATVTGAGIVTLTADDNGVAANSVVIAKSVATPANVSLVQFAGGLADTRKKVSIFNGVGASLLTYAKELVLHPQALAVNDRSEDFTMPLAMTPGQMTFSYKLDDERIYSVEFTAYPNSDTRLLAIVGDKSLAG